jgi:hypothetical protein
MAINNKKLRNLFKSQLEKSGTFLIEREPAKLGDFSGTVMIPDMESMVYARRINGQVVQVFNNAVPNIPHLDVIIGRDKSQPAIWKVIEARLVNDTSQIPSYVGFHHKQHEYPAPDTVFVRRDQFTPLLVLPAGGFTVRLFGDVIYRTGMAEPTRVLNQDIDLTAYQAGTGEAYWVLLEVDINGNLNYVQGNTVSSFALLEFEPIPAPTDDSFPICAFAFYDGQTELRRDDDERTIIDLRDFTSNTTTPGVVLHEADEKIAIADDDEVFGADSEDSYSSAKWLFSTIRSWIIAFADLLYAAVGHTHTLEEVGLSGMQYRQFVYIVESDNFEFVIDEDGHPVFSLEELE